MHDESINNDSDLEKENLECKDNGKVSKEFDLY